MEIRKKHLQEIKDFVNNQATLVQDDAFEQVMAHHLTTDFKIRNMDVSYIAANAIYSANGKNYRYSELSDDEIYFIHYFIFENENKFVS